MQWADCPIEAASLVFFDLETTGLRPDRGARITEMAVVDVQGIRFDWTWRPRAHPEKGDAAPDRPGDEVVAPQIPRLVRHLEAGVVVGHNLAFDFRFLSYEAERLWRTVREGEGRREALDLRFIDTLALARLRVEAESYALGDLLARFDRAPAEPLHTALGDALATRALFRRLVDDPAIETLADAGLQRLTW